MLKNAKNYEMELQMKLRETWYDPTYQYYHSGSYFSDLDMTNDNHYYFVSCVDSKLIGFISYRINRAVNSVSQFGAISFEIGNPVFTRDIAQAIDDIFNKYHFNRLEWYCIDGNPVADHYLKFCKEHGGTVMAVEHECVRTLDGDIRGSIGFEILAKNYTKSIKSIKSAEKYKEYKTEDREKDRKILASMLDNNEYGHEMTEEDIKWAKEHNLVVVFGASDDLMEFRGAIDDETGCFEGDTVLFTKKGVEIVNGEYIGKNIIEACWCEIVNGEHFSWSYKTDIPHSTFVIWEDYEPYCLGIVFSVDDLK